MTDYIIISMCHSYGSKRKTPQTAKCLNVPSNSLINGGNVAPGVVAQHISMTCVDEAVLERPADVNT